MNSLCNLKPIENTDKIKIHSGDTQASIIFSLDLARRLKEIDFANRDSIILLCIGTDRSTGDSLGPLTGSKLSAAEQDYFTIYGTLDQPVHASNLNEKLEQINSMHKRPLIIALDASLGSLESVGCVTIGDGSLQPGAGVNKNLPRVGEIHITGIVNVGGFMEYMVLQNTRLSIVMNMSDIIVEGLLNTIPLVSSTRSQTKSMPQVTIQ